MFRFEEDVLALRPRIVVLLIGINDLTARQPAVQTLSNIRAMLELSRRRAPEPIVILCTVPPSDNSQAPVDEMQRRLVNDGLRKIAGEESSVLLVDLFAALSDPGGKPRPELFVADRLHFSAAGYSEWKKALMPALQKAGSL